MSSRARRAPIDTAQLCTTCDDARSGLESDHFYAGPHRHAIASGDSEGTTSSFDGVPSGSPYAVPEHLRFCGINPYLTTHCGSDLGSRYEGGATPPPAEDVAPPSPTFVIADPNLEHARSEARLYGRAQPRQGSARFARRAVTRLARP
jgi:hypothetical protein